MNQRIAFTIAAVFLGYPVANGAIISVQPSVSGAVGAYSFAYQLENQSAASVIGFSLFFTGALDAGSVQSPVGWIATTMALGPENSVQWISTEPAYDISGFGTLAGFAISSPDGPGDVMFLTLDDSFVEFAGQAVGPSVPEPNSLILIATSIIVLCTFASKISSRRNLPAPRNQNRACR